MSEQTTEQRQAKAATGFGVGRRVKYSDYAKSRGLKRSPKARSDVGTVAGYSRDRLPLVTWDGTKGRHAIMPAFLEWADE